MVVVFGAAGDLSRRKLLPALYHLHEEGLMSKRYRIIGSARRELSDDAFRDLARRSVDEFCRCRAVDPSWGEFSEALS